MLRIGEKKVGEKTTRDIVISFVEDHYGIEDEDTENIIEEIMENYSHERIREAKRLKWDLMDLDSWEYINRLYEENTLKKIIELIGLKSSKSLEEVLQDGKLYMDEIDNTLYEVNVYVMDLESYSEEELLDIGEDLKEYYKDKARN